MSQPWLETSPRDHRGHTHVLVFAGGIHATPLERALGTPTLHMWVSTESTILDEWLDAASAVSSLPVKVLGQDPEFEHHATPRAVLIEDSDSYRGTAGVVRDAAARFADERSTLVVCEGRRRPSIDLADVCERHRERGNGVTIACDLKDEFLGVYVIDASLLENSVPRVGYQDIKEQWLSKIRASGVRVETITLSPSRFSAPIHTREDLLRAADLRQHAMRRRHAMGRSGGAVLASSATVDASARLQNSIVFGGGRVGRDAVVVRSVIGPGRVVEAGRTLVDAVIA